jgi:hypothetical protein
MRHTRFGGDSGAESGLLQPNLAVDGMAPRPNEAKMGRGPRPEFMRDCVRAARETLQEFKVLTFANRGVSAS